MRNKSTLFYSVSQVKVLNEIYWQKGQVAFKLCKSLKNSTGHGPGGQHYCQTLGVPQGSVLGPILFSLYTTPLSKVIQYHPGISFQFYTDDIQLYVHFTHKNVASALDKLSHCLEDVKRWLSTNKLKQNPDETEVIVFGSKSQREKLNHSFPVNILGNLISATDAVRNLGVWFHSDFSFSCHVMKVCKACFAHVRDLK